MSEPLLSIHGLVIEGRSDGKWLRLVNGVDLELGRGETLGLIGESGVGKSLVGLAAMGVARAGCRIAGGTVTFDGVDLRAASEEARRAILGRRIAHVAQTAADRFNPALRIIDQHAEGPVVHSLKTAMESGYDAVDLYRRLGLPSPETFGDRSPHEASRGELQRAMIAAAFACRPDLIVFDEPTAALDPTTRIDVLAAIRELRERFGAAALYITHDLAVAAQMADRIKVLLNGEEVEEAPTRELLDRPKAAYTRTLWSVRRHERRQMPVPDESETPVISIEGVSAAYGDAPALADVSFAIHRARTVAVVGESGSGKSTIARCVTGLLPPTSGVVKHNGVPLPADYRQRGADQLRQVQMVHQTTERALNPMKRIGDIVGRSAHLHTGLEGERLRTRVEELLAMLELDPDRFYHRRPPELSAGQRQRVGVARALAAEPEFIICDEVTSALDQRVAEGILTLLDRLQKELDLAYMMITSDLTTASAVADEVVVMRAGRVVERGPTDEMFTSPRDPYTDRLLSSAPEIDPDWLTRRLAAREGDAAGEAAPTEA